MNLQSSRSFRLVCRPEQVSLVESLLRVQGFQFETDPFYPLARRLTHGPLPLGSSLAAFFGYMYIQDRSSMLPPLALAPGAGAGVLDMCASPGSKTGLLACLVGKAGFVLGNEPSAKRLATLRRNLKQQSLCNTGTCSCPGERLPLPDAGEAYSGWECIQLDPPCSGWGTVDKNPQVLQLWQGDKLKTLVHLQRRLLAEAARLLRPGGRLVYSTCTTNVEENEAQVRYAREFLGLEFLPLPPLPGFALAEPEDPSCRGVWRVNTGEDGQGFFVALFQKPGQPRQDIPAADTQPAWDMLSRENLESPGFNPSLLPPGDTAVFNDVIHFLPEAATGLLPGTFAWKGFPLGKLDKSGKTRTDAYLHSLMPVPEQARARGLPCLDVDDPAPVLALISGQSLGVEASGPETGLYFRGLPLCRLTNKGRRAILPPRQG